MPRIIHRLAFFFFSADQEFHSSRVLAEPGLYLNIRCRWQRVCVTLAKFQPIPRPLEVILRTCLAGNFLIMTRHGCQHTVKTSHIHLGYVTLLHCYTSLLILGYKLNRIIGRRFQPTIEFVQQILGQYCTFFVIIISI